MKALLMIDIQNDFLPGGALAVEKSAAIIPVVNRLQEYFDLVIATQDWHPLAHQSFAAKHPGKQNFDIIYFHGKPQILWPVHCVRGTHGAAFPASLKQDNIDLILRKGTNEDIDSYSAFYEGDRVHHTGLKGYLKEKQVEEVYVTGLAADTCVYYSAMDSVHEGFKTFIIEDATTPIRRKDFQSAENVFLNQGGDIILSSAVMKNSVSVIK